jgi:hypothetical protein
MSQNKSKEPEPTNFANTGAKPSRFDLWTWISSHSSVVSFLGVMLALLGFLWVIHSEIAELNSRVGVVEGKIDVLIQGR